MFAFRAWIVTYLVFAAATGPGDSLGWSATAIAAVINLLGLPSSVLGNEISQRFGRHRTITTIMLSSAVLACVLGFSASWPFWLVVVLSLVYGCTVTGDSGSITAGVVAAAPDAMLLRGRRRRSHAPMAPTVARPLTRKCSLAMAQRVAKPQTRNC